MISSKLLSSPNFVLNKELTLFKTHSAAAIFIRRFKKEIIKKRINNPFHFHHVKSEEPSVNDWIVSPVHSSMLSSYFLVHLKKKRSGTHSSVFIFPFSIPLASIKLSFHRISIRQTSPEDFVTETSLSLSSTVDYDNSQGRVKVEKPLILPYVIRNCNHNPATLHCVGLAIVCRQGHAINFLPLSFPSQST
jgi:hypothetical protein